MSPDQVRVLAALADPTRLGILEELLLDQPRTQTSLAGTRPISRQAVTKHVKVLADAGLVDLTREGRVVRVTAVPEMLLATSRWLADIAARGAR